MSERTAADVPLPGGDFRLFITRLSLQGFLACGLMENPITGKAEINAPTAQMVLDDLKMLQEKTAGQLEIGEAETLNKAIQDLGGAVAALDTGDASAS